MRQILNQEGANSLLSFLVKVSYPLLRLASYTRLSTPTGSLFPPFFQLIRGRVSSLQRLYENGYWRCGRGGSVGWECKEVIAQVSSHLDGSVEQRLVRPTLLSLQSRVIAAIKLRALSGRSPAYHAEIHVSHHTWSPGMPPKGRRSSRVFDLPNMKGRRVSKSARSTRFPSPDSGVCLSLQMASLVQVVFLTFTQYIEG